MVGRYEIPGVGAEGFRGAEVVDRNPVELCRGVANVPTFLWMYSILA